jgi:hypothetical protein
MSKKIESRIMAISEVINFDYNEQYKKEFIRKELIYWSKFTASLCFMIVSTFLIFNLKGIS